MVPFQARALVNAAVSRASLRHDDDQVHHDESTVHVFKLLPCLQQVGGPWMHAWRTRLALFMDKLLFFLSNVYVLYTYSYVFV